MTVGLRNGAAHDRPQRYAGPKRPPWWALCPHATTGSGPEPQRLIPSVGGTPPPLSSLPMHVDSWVSTVNRRGRATDCNPWTALDRLSDANTYATSTAEALDRLDVRQTFLLAPLCGLRLPASRSLRQRDRPGLTARIGSRAHSSLRSPVAHPAALPCSRLPASPAALRSAEPSLASFARTPFAHSAASRRSAAQVAPPGSGSVIPRAQRFDRRSRSARSGRRAHATPNIQSPGGLKGRGLRGGFAATG
jgi:hypothetical protein